MIKKLSLLILLLIPNFVFAEGYEINNYDVSVNIEENNIMKIEERISTNFTVEKHGIIRQLPLKNTVVHSDGSTVVNYARITDIYTNVQKSVYTENGNKVIKIGDPNRTLTGNKEYVIEYTYNIGNDQNKKYDEVYFNIIGTNWDTNINRVTFVIKMPKDFDESKIGFSAGSYGSATFEDVKYSVTDNTITGYYEKRLEAYEGLTIRIELPEGYFEEQKNGFDFLLTVLIVLSVLFSFISYTLWKKHGDDPILIEPIKFYPPENMNSLDAGRILNGMTHNNHIVSLVVYLANKGYIQINEIDEKGLLKTKPTFELVKLKDYEGQDENERTFMDGLFKVKDTIRQKDIGASFATTISKIQTNQFSKKIYETKSLVMILPVVLMAAVIFGLFIERTIYFYGHIEAVSATLFTTLVLAIILGILIALIKKIGRVIMIILFMVTVILPNYLLVYDIFIDNKLYLVAFIVFVISIVLQFICIIYMPKRTDESHRLKGELLGFKRFLEVSEKEQLEALVEKNPNYFYDILPYMYVLGVSKKWISKFETMATTPPTWYNSNHAFNAMAFNSFIDTTFVQATSALTSATASAASSSGGGFSGGGSGGGGGSSW